MNQCGQINQSMAARLHEGQVIPAAQPGFSETPQTQVSTYLPPQFQAPDNNTLLAMRAQAIALQNQGATMSDMNTVLRLNRNLSPAELTSMLPSLVIEGATDSQGSGKPSQDEGKPHKGKKAQRLKRNFKKGDTIHSCQVPSCDYASYRSNNLSRHLKDKHTVRSHFSWCCARMFFRRHDFEVHVAEHHKMFPCPLSKQCTEKFMLKNEAKRRKLFALSL